VIELDTDHISPPALLDPCAAGKHWRTDVGSRPHPRSLDARLHLPEVATVQERVLRLVSRHIRWG
jgi:hypothetical protein